MFFGIPPFPFGKDKRKSELSINKIFQQQAADIIVDLINQGKIKITNTLIDCYDDRKIFMFQLLVDSTYQEICMLQQIEYFNGKKVANIYFQGRKKKWDKGVLRYLLDVAFEKAPEPEPFEQPHITVIF